MFEETANDMLKDAPIWMRLTFLCNCTHNNNDDQIDWEKVNKILEDNASIYDFSAYEKITTRLQLHEARINCIASDYGLGAWYKATCKTCGEEFYMTKGEVKFFEKNNLQLPKRCQACRKGEKKAKITNKILPIIEEEKTAIQIAMEKAGVK
jgi:hypothetical protein